ncbi:prefoldin subunit 5 [Brachionus plicatilis]|uniref:Prefoldin subunit 5 n=1 Tax=Brachionus plicatilis TaxID=10195 RepID=A0A3M7RKR9_BRAPC|nr:prefoldin subunit 5 [Brachionus plicatilis]
MSSQPEAQGEAINLTKLSLQQLDQLKNQLTQEVNVLQESLSRLKMVQQSFVSSDISLEQLKKVEEQKYMLVPLTGSLYVPGKLISNSKVTVDIGTGYYVKKSVEDAKKYFEKKIQFLAKQMEQLQPILQQKVLVREDVMDVFTQKYQIQLQAQKSATAGSQ